MKGKKFAMSVSGGKDSSLALYRALKEGMIPVELFTTYNEAEDRSYFHSIPGALLDELGKALGIPMNRIKITSEPGDYGRRFEEHLRELKEQGVEVVVYGDIDIEDHLKWCTDRAVNAGLEPYFPLWQQSRESLVYECLDSGFEAVIVVVDLSKLPAEFCGKILTKEVAEEIKKLGSDMCGENGEYHTFTFNGPTFKYPVPYKAGEVVKSETHARLRLFPASE